MMMEVEPLSWEHNDLEFAHVMIEEADEIMGDAMASLTFLNNQPDLLNDLRRNVKHIYKGIKKQKSGDNNLKI